MTAETHDGIQIDRTYDACGRPIEVVDSWGGTVSYRYGARGYLESIRLFDRQFGIEWDPSGVLSAIRYPNGLRQEFTQDVCGRLSERTMMDGAGQRLAWRRWVYDGGDQVVATRDWLAGARRYIYDRAGRLESVQDEAGTTLERYAYDACDNLSMSHRFALQVGAGDRVVQCGEWRFAYDGCGSRIAALRGSEEWGYVYDADQQLTRVLKDGTLVAEYRYDLLIDESPRKSDSPPSTSCTTTPC